SPQLDNVINACKILHVTTYISNALALSSIMSAFLVADSSISLSVANVFNSSTVISVKSKSSVSGTSCSGLISTSRLFLGVGFVSSTSPNATQFPPEIGAVKSMTTPVLVFLNFIIHQLQLQ